MKFSDLNLMQPIQRAIQAAGYETPTPIQAQAIPVLLQGKDLLGCAQTGTGKTAAFALPIIHKMATDKKPLKRKHARTLILTPTRELAIQIFDNFKTYSQFLPMNLAVIFGGVGQSAQVKAVEPGVDVLIATPGRLLDLIEQRLLSLESVDTFVLDEADRMLDMGFIHDIRKILPMLPKKRHNLFFSATMPPDIQKLADTILVNPTKVQVNPVSSTAHMIEQKLMYVDKPRKRDLLKYLLEDNSLYKVIVFTRTKFGANRVVEVLEKSKIPSAAIHGNKSQNARQRALESFRSGETRVLVATDIAARGIDVEGITHVINFEIPNIAESYVHRIGRTARAGAQGVAISFCDLEEKAFIKDIEKLIKKEILVVADHPFHSEMIAGSRPLSAGKAKAMIEQQEKKEGAHRDGAPKKRFNKFKKKFNNSNGNGQKASSANGNGSAQGSKKSSSGGGKPAARPQGQGTNKGFNKSFRKEGPR